MVNSSVLLGSNEIIYTKKPLSVVKKQQLEPDMEQQTGSKSGKEYVKAVYCHSDYLTYMQSTSSRVL